MNDRKTTEKSPQPAQPQPGTRRQWLLGAGGVLAAAGAGVWAWQRWSGQAGAGQTAAEQAFWALQLPGLDGQLQALQQYQGRPLLVNFWATWCPPCKMEIPWFIEFQEQYGEKGFQVLGVSVDDPPERLPPFAREYGTNYPLLVGADRDDVQEAFGPIFGIPVTVIIGRDGRICKRHLGPVGKEQFESEIKALL